MNGSGGFRTSSYHVEEFDNTARYHNHYDEASNIKCFSVHKVSVPAEKLKQEPSKEIKCILNEK